MRVQRDGEQMQWTLTPDEALVLEQELDDLDAALEAGPPAPADAGRPAAAPAGEPAADHPGGDDPAAGRRAAALARLFPAAYPDDPAAAAAFHDMTAAGLLTDRVARIETCLAELAAGRGRRRVVLELDPDAVERWLRVLNDVRLVLGVELDVREDDDGRLDPADPQVARRARYVWLTAVQDTVVQHLLGG